MAVLDSSAQGLRIRLFVQKYEGGQNHLTPRYIFRLDQNSFGIEIQPCLRPMGLRASCKERRKVARQYVGALFCAFCVALIRILSK